MTLPVPWVEPKPDPVTTTCVPDAPLLGDMLVITGLGGVGGATIEIDVLPLIPPNVAVIFDVPTASGITIPCTHGLVRTGATEASEDVHVAMLVRLVELPSEKFPVAVNGVPWLGFT
jgi:hypothetical protein